MPEKILRFASVCIFLLISVSCFAQQKVEMADAMRSNGKIYVVVAVCITILLGLFIYVLVLDKKISRIEKNSRG